MRTAIIENGKLVAVHDFESLSVAQAKNLEFVESEIDWDTKTVYLDRENEREWKLLDMVDTYLVENYEKSFDSMMEKPMDKIDVIFDKIFKIIK
jgi:hypothetical protein